MANVAEFTLTFVDGEVRTVKRRPVHLMRAERLLPKDAGGNEILLATFWAAATGGKGSRTQFEEWVETVEDWARVDPEDSSEADADPPGQEPGTSLD